MSQQSPTPDVIVSTKPKADEKTKIGRIPPYNVILENDDLHSFDFVVEVIQKALGYAKEKAWTFTVQAHNSGRAVVWTGPKEVAELKLEQIRSFHEIRVSDQTKLGPLSCTIEPAPGG
ncbi:MAG TPA: ATP-dependent Clp protease adaptor ClpS [Gemmataceae bacterium]|nr:ATP-dependent Clp protease adaptor ClpS [Gemmataceae bacterium]